jgi:two-component system, NtrC family, nitrogen regulation sensor histidine kinase NtrY
MLGMTPSSTKYARPALWGFFICIVLAAAMAVVRMVIPSIISYGWDKERIELQKEAVTIIHESFQSKTDQLTKIINAVIRDTSFNAILNRNDVSAARIAFLSLSSSPVQSNQTIDLVDTMGNVLAWNGPSIASLYNHISDHTSIEPLVYITQNGLRIYLTVGKRLAQNRLTIFVSEPMEVNSPISNRFIQRISFCERISQRLKTQVSLKPPGTYHARGGEYSVPIVDEANTIIAEFFVTEPTLNGKISSAIEVTLLIGAMCLACACLAFACAGMFWIAKYQKHWLTTTIVVASFWFVRILWRELNFPANVIGGWLFNPNLYASPFAFGLCSSLGDLFLTVLTAAASGWLLFSQTLLKSSIVRNRWRMTLLNGRIVSLSVAVAAGLIILWIFRGFGEAIRSFVFDSTIHYSNPSELLLHSPAALMVTIAIMLGLAVFCTAIVLLYFEKQFLIHQYYQSKSSSRILFFGMNLICIPLFAYFDQTEIIPLLLSAVFVCLCLCYVEVIVSWKHSGFEAKIWWWKLAVWMIVGSFVFGAVLLHRQLEQRERREVEIVGSEFLRPSDSWLMFAVQDGLRTTVESMTGHLDPSLLATAKDNNLAFVLWTKSIIGKEGYNSALLLYDQRGNEVDRFIVGMNKPEQQSILTKVFAGEEEAVHVIDQAEPTMLGKLYGAWTTIRDSSGQPIGSIALLLSEHKKAIFHEEDTEPLRQFGDRLENSAVREIAVHIYNHDTLTYSTGRRIYPDRILSGSIEREFQTITSPYLWKNIRMNGYRTQTVFMRDNAIPERIACISLQTLDFRWDMLNYIKELFVCLLLLASIALCTTIRKMVHEELPSLSFRAKLLIGFACITLVPLVVLSTYNRQLVTEQVQKRGEGELYSKLSILQERLSAYVSDEEDFVKGIDDDFCEVLASEYGIDFSVYRNGSIQASSRSELYRSSILDGRLNGTVFASIVYDGRRQVLTNEKIGSVEYVVGYSPVIINGTMVGILAIPTLNRQKDIEAELSQQHATVFGMYAIIFGIALVIGALLASRFSRPIHILNLAAKNIAEGNLEITVPVPSRDEIGTLAQSFNEMVVKLRVSRDEQAKHERETAWKEMAKQVAHEIKNPLTPIKLSIQHVRQAFKDRAPDREEILQRVTKTVIDQIDTLSRIATEFSHFAKLPERKYERVEIDDLLKNTINVFREVKGIRFVDHLDSPAVTVVADSDQLRGVFINIIRNAIQAIEKTGTITIRSSKGGRMCQIIISDTGQGIPEELRSKIFEPNFSTKTEGMGIGLAIARRVIEDHGGTIICQSEQGRGTTFEIHLPI